MIIGRNIFQEVQNRQSCSSETYSFELEKWTEIILVGE